MKTKQRGNQTLQANVKTNAPRPLYPIKIDLEWWKWDEFVNNCGLVNKKLYDYYLGKNINNRTVNADEKLITELFADAVEVGALILPPPHTTQDFIFTATDFTLKANGKNNINIYVALKPRTSKKKRANEILWYLQKDLTMSNPEVIGILDSLSRPIRSLVNK